jgi:hypothetical protein
MAGHVLDENAFPAQIQLIRTIQVGMMRLALDL